MNQVFVKIGDIISALGFDLEQNINSIKNYNSGIELLNHSDYSSEPFYAAIINPQVLDDKFSVIGDPKEFTKAEKMLLLVLSNLINKYPVNLKSPESVIIISTTKGNIDLLEKPNAFVSEDRIYLWSLANVVQKYFNAVNQPIVVSHACISGLSAIIMGARLIKAGLYRNVIVCGADVLSKFIVSGFQSFKSLGTSPCKPFDKNRDGLTLGEGAGALLLTSDTEFINEGDIICYEGGAISNDANHISGPSPIGKGLNIAISKALDEYGISLIDYISAHGTATVYNDDMESTAIMRSGMTGVPVNGMKGYWGHALGAAGIIETIAGIKSAIDNEIYATMGLLNPGVRNSINLITKHTDTKINSFMKIASGFGGCNAAAIFSKD